MSAVRGPIPDDAVCVYRESGGHWCAVGMDSLGFPQEVPMSFGPTPTDAVEQLTFARNRRRAGEGRVEKAEARVNVVEQDNLCLQIRVRDLEKELRDLKSLCDAKCARREAKVRELQELCAETAPVFKAARMFGHLYDRLKHAGAALKDGAGVTA